MPKERPAEPSFGDGEKLDASLSERVRGLIGSEILKIAADIRTLVAEGKEVCNLTVGDFNSRYFPIPEPLLDGIRQALAEGETNYPPSNGIPELRKAVTEYSAREWGARYPQESVLIAGGDCKGADFAELGTVLEGRVRAVVLIGRDAGEIAAVVPASVPQVTADDMDDAVAQAASLALAGDRVLLSPGCASFDMFSGFAERGERFMQAVRRRLS